MNQTPRYSTPAEAFKTCFSGIAAFLGRPSAHTVLFTGVPLGPGAISFEEIEFVSNRVGIEARSFTRADFVRHRVELPAIVFMVDRPPVALLSEQDESEFNTLPQDSGRTTISRGEIIEAEISQIVGFSLTYANTNEEARLGSATIIEKRHWLTGTLAPFWRSYIRVGLAACFINLIALGSPIFTMNVYDRILPNKAVSSLWVLAIGLAISILFDLLLKTARAALIDYAGRKADLRISYLLFEKVLNASLATKPLSTGEYANRVTQYEFVREFFTSNTISVLIDTMFVFVFLFVIWLVAGWLVVVPTVAFVAALTVGLVTQYRIGKCTSTAMNESSQRQALLIESISTLETVKALRAESYLLRRWRELSKNAAHTSERIKQLSAAAANITQFIQQLVTVVIIVMGAYIFAAGDITTGAIIAAVMLSGRAVAPLAQIAITLSRLRQALLSLKILNGIMAQPEDLPNTVGFVNRPIRNGAVAFKDVSFVYPGTEAKVINGLSFQIRPGERVGIIGRIGSGKTTIGRLLGRLYLPTSGDLLIDGIDVRQYHPAEIRSAVGIAGQTGDLFSGTIKENLLMAKPDASDEEIIAAARQSGVDEFVSRHPRGYDMNVGERGSSLSGGQKQAVAIARLLIAKPKIVFLDEPSGSMDLASERLLIRQLSQAFDSDTTIIISTHRFSMLELVDRLIVVDQGRVIADGPKAQVIQALQKGSAEVPAVRKAAE
ncbi:type I secretion system permease/ATPase [Mesorhizobium sp. BAC0120]|uniref:type I secretion system permease/ATPase n=1 Tax=Mesorhizobium sp. BAC0120 TaxID=3090670 RepID=UPI00298D0CD9|nr:type I secretion system permease/ATPase [Mesorhizobium sp. BAC0120]MDW6026547.1 type I secretion system permease/ATPase [Mesorhizobium sp. BAC0120]